jgi:hypothetical protein
VTHDSGPSTLAFRPRRRVLVVAVLATLFVAVLALWAATERRDLDPPLMITPALGAEPSSTLAPPPSATPSSPSPSATPKATRSKSARPSPKASSRRPSASPSPAPPPALSARYVGGDERRGMFSAGIALENEGRTARTWEVRVTYDAGDRVRVERVFGARVSTSGSTLIFTGGPLEPGDDTMFGFSASTSGDGQIRPTSCQVDGRACTISFR